MPQSIPPSALADWLHNLLTRSTPPQPARPHPFGSISPFRPMADVSPYVMSLIHGAPDRVPTHTGATGSVGIQRPHNPLTPKTPSMPTTTDNDSPLESALRDFETGRGAPGQVAGLTPWGLVQQGAGLASAADADHFHASELAKQLGMVGIGALIHHQLHSDLGEVPLMTPRPSAEAEAVARVEQRAMDAARVNEAAVAPYSPVRAPAASPFAFDRSRLAAPDARAVANHGLLDINFPFSPKTPLEDITGKRFAILTAENPNGQTAHPTVNAARNAQLEADLRAAGHSPVPVKGAYTDDQTGELLNENSYLVPGMSPSQGIAFGRKYNQNSIITHQGSHSTVTGQLSPSTGMIEGIHDAPFSELPDGRKFRLNIDWNNPLPKNANPDILDIVNQLNQGPKMPRVSAVDPAKAGLMAKVYESLPENDPAARPAYDALNREVAQQYKALQGAGYKFQFVDKDPYKNSTEMMDDVRNNKTLKVLKTPGDNFHPYMTPEQNDQFRAVHDAIAHAGEGNQFGPVGEENAFRVHASTLSPEAQQALASETRGQNSWVNFGPNAHLPVAQRPFAVQKAALWPKEWLGDYHEMPDSFEGGAGPSGSAPTAPDAPPSAPENLTHATIKLPDGRIFGGPTHLNAVDAAHAKGVSYDDLENAEDGFATTQRPHISRLDATYLLNPELRGKDVPMSRQVDALNVAAWHNTAPAVVTPPTSGEVFDDSKLGPNVPAGVDTDRPPVKYPPRAVMPQSDLITRRFRNNFTANATRALAETPEAGGWYDLSQMRDAMSDLSPTGEDDFKKFALFMGPTSTGTTVPQNIKQASAFYHLWKNGMLNESDLRNGTVQMPQGFAHRRQASVNSGILRILENGNLDPYTQPKTYRYANAIAGNGWGGAALDMHVGRQVGPQGLLSTENGMVPARGFPTGGYDETNEVTSSPKNHFYPLIEDKAIHEANKMSLPPTIYQSLGWVGGADQTNVADTRPLLQLMNERFRVTGQKLGMSPLDAFRAFAQGKTPLYGIAGLGAGAGLLGAYGNRNQDPTSTLQY